MNDSLSKKLTRLKVSRKSTTGASMSHGLFSRVSSSKLISKRPYIWPIIAAVIFTAMGLWVNRDVENAMRKQRSNELTTILNADVSALKIWLNNQKKAAYQIANNEQLKPLIRDLLATPTSPAADPGAGDANANANKPVTPNKAQEQVRLFFKSYLESSDFMGFFVLSPELTNVAGDLDASLGKPFSEYPKEFMDKILKGETGVSKPYRSPFLLLDSKKKARLNLPTMFVAAPVLDGPGGKPIAVLGLRIRPEDQFTQILQVARSGESGETYAFDKDGLMLSQSRFDEDLKQIGLLVDEADSQSILTLLIRDPGVNMVEGDRSSLRRPDQPLTKMAGLAATGQDGIDADGYRDYRGVPVCGAWVWLKEYDFGVTTEVDVWEAMQPVYYLRRAFWILMGGLGIASGAIFMVMMIASKQQRALSLAKLASKQLGQYILEDKLGTGGMGAVYKAKHSMMRRPTAIKLLDLEKISDTTIARFEREVQLTSSLTHPNTVAIFDFGRTDEGIFYYAMEYLEGANLEDLIRRYGPINEARAIFILKQICSSLTEAHEMNLVHRDIKPANIFLTCRGGIHDFVKVLDFGLAKTLESEEANLTSANAITGTPLYLAPEALQNPTQVEATADIYSIGTVAYFLLTGVPVFMGSTILDICMMHAREAPEPPSSRAEKVFNPVLEDLILRCLAKSPSERPANATELLRELEKIELGRVWTTDDARNWWQKHGAWNRMMPSKSSAGLQLPSKSRVSALDLKVGAV